MTGNRDATPYRLPALTICFLLTLFMLCGGPGLSAEATETGLTSTVIKSVKAGSEEAGFQLVRADDLGGRITLDSLSPSQAFEILRPDMGEISISRLGTSCSCIRLSAEKKTFAKGERAILELRNVKPTKQGGGNYAIYVLVVQPEPAMLRLRTFVRSETEDISPEEQP